MKKLLVLMAFLWMSPALQAGAVQTIESIQDAVMTFVKAGLDGEGEYQITMPQMDNRLQLPQCDQPLQLFVQSGAIKAGRNTIGVACKGSANWTIYSVVPVKAFKNVVVLTKPMRRRDIFTADTLATEARDISGLPPGFIVNTADILNKQASRNLSAGMVLNKLAIEEVTLVKRGDRIKIESGQGGMSISTMGVAMSDGVNGERISVKNSSSQRVIQAVVVGAGVVSVAF
jgi:flagella basal body P-ring formation protein FlgA